MAYTAPTTEQSALAAQLQRLLPQVPQQDQKFAAGLLDSFAKFGQSAGRMHWIGEMVKRAQPDLAGAEPTSANVGSFHKVMALFNLAKQNLKKPRIRLMLADRQPLVLAVAGAKAKQPGTVDVTDGGSYGMSKWFGRVTLAGEFTHSPHYAGEADEITAILKKLGEAPAQVAAEYGRLTGRCCFCNLPLSDERSTAAGFGRTCATNYGLLDSWKESDAVLKSREAQEVAG